MNKHLAWAVFEVIVALFGAVLLGAVMMTQATGPAAPVIGYSCFALAAILVLVFVLYFLQQQYGFRFGGIKF